MANSQERPFSCKTVGNQTPTVTQMRNDWNLLLERKLNLLDERDKIDLEIVELTK